MNRSMQTDFWPYVDMSPNGCWNWTGTTTHGYGYVKTSLLSPTRTRRAHRVAYENLVGNIPIGLQLDHICRNRACVNPEHLRPVSARENTLRSTSPSAVFAVRNTCNEGHPLSGGNLLLRKDGGRKCRACHAAYMRTYRSRRAA